MIVALLIATAFMLLAWRSMPQRQRAFDYLYDRAEQLEFDRERIVAIVRDDLTHETYAGCLRGPVGTLWAGAGNSLDRALLLAGLLEFSERGVQLAQRGQTWWVRVLTGDGWRDITTDGQPVPGEPDWVGDQLPEHLHHRLLVTVEVADGPDTTRRTAQYRTADLVGHPLVLHFEQSRYDLGPRGTSPAPDAALMTKLSRSCSPTSHPTARGTSTVA